MRTIQKLEAIQTPLKTVDGLPHKVCAYCRVSTDDTDQRNSLKSQEAFFHNFFEYHPNWINVGIFADEGISGTSLAKRDRFNEMLMLARRGSVEIILTKEVSRFSRNVQHLLNIVEELRSIGVYIWFLSDDINTESSHYREQLTQVATNAEQESLRTSRRVRWGQQQRMEQGTVFGRKSMFGYRIDNDRFTIVPEEAEIVRNVFRWYAAGDAPYTIVKRLQRMGIHKCYKNGWSNTVVLRILRNEKYVGDLAQGKTYTPDPLTHKKKYNRGESVRYYITDHHPESAIIDRALWNKVQSILKEKDRSVTGKAAYANRYWLSGKIHCGICGSKYISIIKKNEGGTYQAWACFNNHKNGLPHEITCSNGEPISVGCTGKRVNERVLKLILRDILGLLVTPKKEEICLSLYNKFRNNTVFKDNIAEIKERIKKKEYAVIALTDKFVDGLITESAYAATVRFYEEELINLQSNLTQKEENLDSIKEQNKACRNELEEAVSLKGTACEEFLSRITKCVIVHPGKILEIHFSFSPKPVFLRYSTKGRGDSYTADFQILNCNDFQDVLHKT